jgi:hypothetical protein
LYDSAEIIAAKKNFVNSVPLLMSVYVTGSSYYEAVVKTIHRFMPLGFVTEGFQSSEEADGEGVGDDYHSWGIIGIYHSPTLMAEETWCLRVCM